MAGTTHHGTFPFGQPNSARPLRPATSREAKALVVGVYPSAFHVSWAPPPRLDPRPEAQRSRPLIQALAVDVEPTVFWKGLAPNPAELLATWKKAVGYDEETHGRVKPSLNGPSGAGVEADVLRPLGIAPEDAAFTDAVPWFFVKGGKGSQGAAIKERFAPLATSLSVDPGSLPTRPSTRALVALAASAERRDDLRTELLDSAASLIITLGQEALNAVRSVADSVDGVQTRLAADGYGARGEVVIANARRELLPLVHPGFRRQVKPESPWVTALADWPQGAGEA